MSRNEVLFFATPGEQANWLRKILVTSSLWCVAWRPQEQPDYQEISIKNISDDLFLGSEEYSLQLYLGNRDLAPKPVWENHSPEPHGELDVIRSQAIEVVPSIAVGTDTLLLGQMALLQDRDYRLAHVDPKPLKAWFTKVSKSLESLHAANVTVVQRTTSGSLKQWEDIWVTPGVVAQKQSGTALKQFVEGAVEFELEEDELA